MNVWPEFMLLGITNSVGLFKHTTEHLGSLETGNSLVAERLLPSEERLLVVAIVP